MTQTWNDINTAFYGLVLNITDTASLAGSRLLDLQIGGVSKFRVYKDGAFDSGGTGTLAAIINSNAAGWQLAHQSATNTTPTILPNRSSLTAGLGGASGGLSMITAGSSRLFIDSTGQVGIGTTSPTRRLSVADGSPNSGELGGLRLTHLGNAVGDNVSLELSAAGNTTPAKIVSIASGGADQDLALVVTDNSTQATAMYIDGDGGKIGIGTTSPGAKLEVVGQIAVQIPATLTPATTTQTINWTNGNIQVVNLASASGNVTLSFTNPVAGAAYAVKAIQGAGSRNIIWPAAVKWPSGIVPTISTTNGAIDLITLFYDGTNYYAASGQNYQ